jgi:hypothetical protein
VVASVGVSFGEKPKKMNYRITLPANSTTEFGFPFELKHLGKCALALALRDEKGKESYATVIRNNLETPLPIRFAFDPQHFTDDEREVVGRAMIQLTPEAMQGTRLCAVLRKAGAKKPLAESKRVDVTADEAVVKVSGDDLKPGAYEVEVSGGRPGHKANSGTEFACIRHLSGSDGIFRKQESHLTD